MHGRQISGENLHDTQRAEDLQPKPIPGGIAVRTEVAGHAIVQAVHRLNRVAGERADTFRPVLHVAARDGVAVLLDRGKTPAWFAAEVAHEIQDVTAQYPQILTAASRVLFAAATQLEDRSQPPLLDEISHGLQLRAVTALERNRQLHAMALAGSRHLVGLGQRATEGFFEIDVHATLGGRQHHFAVLIDPARGDADNVRLHFVQHLAVVREAAGHSQPLQRCRSPLLVRISDRHQLAAGHVEPHAIQIVTVIAPARMSNHRHAKRVHGCVSVDCWYQIDSTVHNAERCQALCAWLFPAQRTPHPTLSPAEPGERGQGIGNARWRVLIHVAPHPDCTTTSARS